MTAFCRRKVCALPEEAKAETEIKSTKMTTFIIYIDTDGMHVRIGEKYPYGYKGETISFQRFEPTYARMRIVCQSEGEAVKIFQSNVSDYFGKIASDAAKIIENSTK